MLAGIEHIYSGQVDDFLPYDDALDFAFESVVQHALKAEQEHFGEPKSISEVMQLAPDERSKWLKAAQDEIQSLVENGTFELVQLPPGRTPWAPSRVLLTRQYHQKPFEISSWAV